MKKNIYIFCTFLLLVILPIQAQKNHNYEVGKNLDIFNKLYKTLDEYYVDTLQPEKLIPEAIQYMLDGLDPYTEYIPTNDARNLQALTTGKYAGIGAIIHYYKDSDRCSVYELYEEMPAAKAGVRAGDIILSINGKDVGKKGSSSVENYTSSISDQLKGDPGTSFVLEVKRLGISKPLKFTLHRTNIVIPAVPYITMVTNDIGYIKLTTFTSGCSDQVRKAVKELKEQGAKNIVLDLRDNGGGLAIEAVDIVNIFVPKGKLILSMKGKYQASNLKYFSRNQPEDINIPLVVLVNGKSASSSEITCGTLQDLDRAVILGERTYGKGLVQQTQELPYGAVLKLTTSHYYIPSGRCIQALDYSRLSSNGEAYRTPDSLTHVFHTAAGREVHDGGGITPDIKSVADTLPDLIYYLLLNDRFMDYCTQYRNNHDTIAPAAEFSITDSDYQEFKTYLEKSNFSYDRQSYKALQELKKIAKSEGYGDTTVAEFTALEKKLSHNLGYDLDQWKAPIIKELNAEIASRYYYKKGYYASLLKDDNFLRSAIRLLHHPDEYNRTLHQ